MSTLKLGLMGATLAAAVVGGAGSAKADEVRYGVEPGRVEVVTPAPYYRGGWRDGWWFRHHHHYRVEPRYRYDYRYNNGYRTGYYR
jgi:hypothetical protein